MKLLQRKRQKESSIGPNDLLAAVPDVPSGGDRITGRVVLEDMEHRFVTEPTDVAYTPGSDGRWHGTLDVKALRDAKVGFMAVTMHGHPRMQTVACHPLDVAGGEHFHLAVSLGFGDGDGCLDLRRA